MAAPESCLDQTFLRPADAEAEIGGRYGSQICCRPAAADLAVPASDHKQQIYNRLRLGDAQWPKC